jgi:WD40 repeat protein
MRDRQVLICELDTDTTIATLPDAGSTFTSVELSPAGDYCATSLADGRLLVWNTADATLISEWLSPKGNGATVMRFSPEEPILAIGGRDSLRAWDFHRRKMVFESNQIAGTVGEIYFSADGRAVSVITSRGHALSWATADWRVLGALNPSNPANAPSQVVPMLGKIVFGQISAPICLLRPDSDGSLKLQDLRTGDLIHTYRNQGTWTAPTFSSSADDRLLASWSGGTFVLWDADSGRQLRTYEMTSRLDAVSRMGFSGELSRDGKFALCVVGETDRLTVRLIALSDVTSVGEPESAAGERMPIGYFSNNGAQIWGFQSARVWVWDVATQSRTFLWHNNQPTAISAAIPLSPLLQGFLIRFVDGSYRIVHSSDASMEVIEGKIVTLVPSRDELVVLEPGGDLCRYMHNPVRRGGVLVSHTDLPQVAIPSFGWPVAAGCSPNGKHFAIATTEGVCVLDLDDHRIQSKFRGPADGVKRIHWHPDSERLLVQGQSSGGLWDAHGHQLAAFELHQPMLVSAGFSPSGRWIWTGGGDGLAHFYDGASGKAGMTLKAGLSFVNHVSFVGEADDIAITCSNERGAVAWDLGSGRELGELGSPLIMTHPRQSLGILITPGTPPQIRPLSVVPPDPLRLSDIVRTRVAWELQGDHLVSRRQEP